MVHKGVVSGYAGPTIILPKCKTKRVMFNYDDLVRKGLDPVSTIIMTENSFIMHDSWYEETKNIIFRYNQMPLIRGNPRWGGF